MQILLPPSETKRPGDRGRPLDLASLSLPELTEARTAVLDALVAVSARPDAAERLGVPAGVADQVRANVELRTAPTRSVAQLYTGVLYDALDLASLDAPARRRAGRSVLVVSALFGALRLGDRVPAYRLAMGAALPGLGPLAGFWSAHLGATLPGAVGRGAVVDLRSSTYAAAWRPTGALADRTVTVRVVRDDRGARTVVSHLAKHTRGLVAHHLLATGARPTSPEDVAAALADRFAVELEPGRPGRPSELTVVEPA